MTHDSLPASKVKHFFDDRHVDKSMSEFISLTTDLMIDGFDLSASIRLPFYLNCLRTDNYQHANHNYLLRLLLAASPRIDLIGAGWISVREGNSQRQKDITQPIIEAIRETGIKAGWVVVQDDTLIKRFRTGLFRTFLCLETTLFFLRHYRNVKNIAHRLMDEFAFDRSFVKWFIINVLSHYILHKRALSLINSHKNSINGLIVGMEYHRLTRALVHAAKAHRIPVVLTQHGFLGQEWLHYPIQADIICLWGEVDRNWYLKRGVDKERLRVTGTHLAFSVADDYRLSIREKYSIEPGQYALVYLAPNALDYSHQKSIRLLDELRQSVSDLSCRWFVRPHRSNKPHMITIYTEKGFEDFPGDVPVEEAFALSDVVIHDYSTMATAEYSGLVTLCLPADPPYPDFYPELLGDQALIENPQQFLEIVKSIKPGYELKARSTVTMAAGECDALMRICDVIREFDG